MTFIKRTNTRGGTRRRSGQQLVRASQPLTSVLVEPVDLAVMIDSTAPTSNTLNTPHQASLASIFAEITSSAAKQVVLRFRKPLKNSVLFSCPIFNFAMLPTGGGPTLKMIPLFVDLSAGTFKGETLNWNLAHYDHFPGPTNGTLFDTAANYSQSIDAILSDLIGSQSFFSSGNPALMCAARYFIESKTNIGSTPENTVTGLHLRMSEPSTVTIAQVQLGPIPEDGSTAQDLFNFAYLMALNPGGGPILPNA